MKGVYPLDTEGMSMNGKNGSKAAGQDTVGELEGLKRSFDNGYLTKEEYERQLTDILVRSGRLSGTAEEKMPGHIADPRKREIHRYHDCAQVLIDFVSDSAKDDLLLMSAEGMEICIVNDLGLEAVIRNAVWSEEKQCLTGNGRIQGYTAYGDRLYPEIMAFFGDDGCVKSLGYWESAEDAGVHRAFPLWQPYYDWVNKGREKMLEKIKENGC